VEGNEYFQVEGGEIQEFSSARRKRQLLKNLPLIVEVFRLYHLSIFILQKGGEGHG